MKLHIVRRITREGVKEYAMQGMQFSTRILEWCKINLLKEGK